jgi:MATE family multidrug resistance protein
VAAFWLGLVGYIAAGVGFAWLFAFPLGHGGDGVWYGLAVGLALVAALALARFHQQTRSEATAFGRLLKSEAPAA